MSNKPYNGRSSTFCSAYVKQDMILSDEEEESATLAEPMTVEGAKQLAQSSTSSVPASIPHILPVVSHPQLVVNTSIHNINSLSHGRPAILHNLIPSSPVPASLHGVGMDHPHLVVPPTISPLHNHGLWSAPTATCADEEGNGLNNYTSTVDIGAIRDSPSPDPFSEKLVTINENWNCQEEHSEENNAADGDDEVGSDDDDSDSSDSDSSLASSSSLQATAKKPQKEDFQASSKVAPYKYNRDRSLSHSESTNSKSESDSRESDIDSSDGSSSDEESSASSCMEHDCNDPSSNNSPPHITPDPILQADSKASPPITNQNEEHELPPICHENFTKKLEPALTRSPERVIDYAAPVVPVRPYVLKPNVHSLISTDSKRQQKLEQANACAIATANALEKAENQLKHVSINSNNHITNKKKLCNNSPKYLKPASEPAPSHKLKSDLHSVKETDSHFKLESSTGKTCPKKQPKMDLKPKSYKNTCSLFHLEEKRLEKKREMDREFDRLLKSTKASESCDIKPVQKSVVKKCIVTKVKGSEACKASSAISQQLIKSKVSNKSKDTLTSDKKNSEKTTLSKSDLKKETKMSSATTHKYEKANLLKSVTHPSIDSDSKKEIKKSSSNYEKPSLPKNISHSSSDSQSSCLSSSDSDEVAMLKTRKRLPTLMATAKIIPDSKCKKSKAKPKPPVFKETPPPKVPISKPRVHSKAEPIERPHTQSSIRPTIADTVKIQGRRKSLEKDRSSSEEKKSDPEESNNCESSSSDMEEVVNEKVDLDTEQTQTFSLSGNSFNQGRLTLKIAAMKMAKFGKRGLKEVTKGGLPMRSRLLSPRRSRMLQLRCGLMSGSTRSTEKHKVKTAAERKTYVDVLPVTKGGEVKKKTIVKADMRVPASSLYRTSSSLTASHNGPTSDDEDHISRIAHHLSQMSHEHITDGLQVLDQEDLAAILPDVAPSIRAVDTSGSSFDPFMESHGSDFSDREISSPTKHVEEASINSARHRSHAAKHGPTTPAKLNKVGKQCDDSSKNKNNAKEALVQSRHKGKVTSQRDVQDEENEHVVMPELESFMPLDCNASNVSPDSGIQSVNSSPLHHVGSPNDSPFYSSNIVSLSGSSVSTAYQPGSTGVNEDGVGTRGSRSYSPNSSPQNYPSPPTLLPALTPPHMTSSPRYYDGSPDSPPMPSLRCQVYPPPWEEGQLDPVVSGSESAKEANVPKKSRGRPKGSKTRHKDYEKCWRKVKPRKKKSLKNHPSDRGKKEENKEIVSDFDCSPLKNKWRSSVADLYDMPPPPEASQPTKRGPGRPKKNPVVVEMATPKQPEVEHHSKESSDVAVADKVVQPKRPVGRPRKHPKSKLRINCGSTPVTLASRKCFSEKIMHKIINENVKNSEKSDKLEEFSQPDDIDKGSDASSPKKSQIKRRRQNSDGIPLLEDKKKKRGRRKELPAIFEKVYGSMKNLALKVDKSKCVFPVGLVKRKKKKKKSFKTKRKNIVDPVFLAEVEKLLGEFEKCHISKNIVAPTTKPGELPLPTIFRFKKAVLSNKKRRVVDKSKASDKESGTEGESGKEKLSGKRKKKMQEVPKQGRERSEASEQRLPLKKRHRHISSAVPLCPDISKIEPSTVKMCIETKDRSSASKSPLRGDCARFVKSDVKGNKTPENCNPLSNKRRVAIAEKCLIEDASMKMLDQFVSVERVKEVTETVEEVIKKNNHSQSTMVATTPKKRHRLESDLSAIGITSNSAVYVPPSPHCAADFNLPTDHKKISQVTQMTIKEENDSFSKLVTCNVLPSDEDNILPEQESLGRNQSRILTGEVVPGEENPVAAVVESSGTHSDSDIPSEHEPLCESDQSGFMSDKETTKEDDFKPVQKKLKKKRELRGTKKDPIPCKEEQALVKSESPVHRKKAKRRKTNKTGFPTVKKKKKKPKIEENKTIDTSMSQEQKEIVSKSTKLNCNLHPKVCVKQLNMNETVHHVVNKSKDDNSKPQHRPRGRPRKKPNEPQKIASSSETTENMKQSESVPSVVKGDSGPPPHRLRKAVPTFRNCKKRDLSSDSLVSISDNKRQRRMADDEVEDSDVFLPSEYHPSSEPVSSDESSRSKQKAPRWRRKYLIAGLFSDYYKQDEPRRNGDLNGCKSKSSLEVEPRNHSLLPAPLYCKKKLRETQKNFLLPYDLWWLHKHNMLPGRDIIASWNYKKVKSNVYYDVKSTFGLDVQSCNCKKPKAEEKACGEDCINRVMFIECSPQHCPVKDICSNQRLQKHENLSCLKKFMTEEKGWGIKATTGINQSCFIMEYVGEVVSEREFRHRMQTKYANDKHHYCLNLDRGLMIDGHRIGSDCRFVNHSCNPNCEMQKWNVNGQYRMALFALKGIEVDEELTYDYNFHLFNPARGQECKCKASNCRGVIGGRSQRLNGQPIEEKKKTSGRNKKESCRKRKRGPSTDTESGVIARNHFMPIKALSHQQRVFILAHRCFLVRNLEKIRKSRDNLVRYHEKKAEEESDVSEEPCTKIQRFMTHFTALNTARSVKTRRLAQAEDDPEMTRIAKLAQIFKDIYDKLMASRDDKEKSLATPFMNLFPKKKYPNYYSRVGEPIDLSIIEKNILTGHYTNVENYDRDLMKLFANNLRFFGRNTEVGKMAVALRKVYSECKLQFKPLLEEVLGEDHLPPAFANCTVNEEFEDEDVIRCVCNLYRDEGTMIQCEKCLVWQHCDCMGVEDEAFPEHYLCEECQPRQVSPEVPVTPQPPDSNNKKHFVTLLRDTLQVKQGDSVYILRDRPKQKSGERRQPAYKLVKDIKYHELLIFKVESLFIDDKGDKYAFGHHFLRPHETFHEPWRKFFPNEVIRSPFCEILALDMIIRHCWVLDLNSYCRGKPIGAVDDHIYVCECRVDKSARVFSKISKPKYLICKKPYAFIQYPEKLRPLRTYTPHEVIRNSKKPKLAPTAEPAPSVNTTKESALNKTQIAIVSGSSSRSNSGSRKPRSNNSSRERASNEEKPTAPPVVNVRTKKRERVNKFATRLLKLLPTKGAVDLGYLLETGKRQRKKTAAFSS